jgi:hypothetical protein
VSKPLKVLNNISQNFCCKISSLFQAKKYLQQFVGDIHDKGYDGQAKTVGSGTACYTGQTPQLQNRASLCALDKKGSFFSTISAIQAKWMRRMYQNS